MSLHAKSKKIVLCALFLLTHISLNGSDGFLDIEIHSPFFDIIMSKLDNHPVELLQHTLQKSEPKKDWTLLLYIAADNDLAPFSIRNIRQMARIGSNNYINIVVQLDVKKASGKKITRRFLIQKGKVLHLNADDPSSQSMDSGNPKTLISFCKWGIETFPSNHVALVLWNHGTGALDPERGRIVRGEELFLFNQISQRLELDRTIGYIDRILDRGICWDDSTGNFLSNARLNYALSEICTKHLDGKKLDFIGFDACLMQMVEVAHAVKQYAHTMVGSQEVELGYGWNYADVLEPFTKGTMTPQAFVTHIVQSFGKTYEKITNDYTLSALNLGLLHFVEKNIEDIALLLIDGLKNQKKRTVTNMIRASRSNRSCTHFDEPTYIDLHDFYTNLIKNSNSIQLQNRSEETQYKKNLVNLLKEGQKSIERMTIANITGKNLSRARGVSIYFPEQWIHYSYQKLSFVNETSWFDLVKQYMMS